MYVRCLFLFLSSKEVLRVKSVVHLEEMPKGLVIITDDMVLIGIKNEEGEPL